MALAQKSMPLYQQIYSDIKTSIKSGVYKSGDQIPSEPELSQTYNVSRMTVRRAVEDLCSDGYLIKQQGRGTFVGKPHVERKFAQTRGAQSFSETCHQAGIIPGGHTIDRQIVPIRPDECEFFNLDQNDLLLYIHRVRTADGVAVCEENVFMPYVWASPLLTMQIENKSLFKLIEELTGKKAAIHTDWTVSAVKATTDQATILAISIGDPLLRMDVKCLSADGTPLYIGRQYFVGSRYELTI